MKARTQQTTDAILYAPKTKVHCTRNDSGAFTLWAGDPDDSVRIIGTARQVGNLLGLLMDSFLNALVTADEAANDDR